MSTYSGEPSTRRRGLAAFTAVNAIGAWGGAIGLVTGAMSFGARLDERLPFGSTALAGLALATIVAVPLTVLAWSAWTGSAQTGRIALVVGLILVGWIVLQVAVLWAFSPFQPAYLCIGAYFVATSHRLQLGTAVVGALLVSSGAMLLAVGVGLGPHLVERGLVVGGVASVVSGVAGMAIVVVGARRMLRRRRLVARCVGSGVVVLAVAVTVWVVAPGVAATNVPDTPVGSTPAELGLASETIRLTTSDGVQLAAWYLQGTNRAGLVMLHGAGSTRSDVLDRAAALAGAGYAVLLVDSRGHGQSGGTAMDFGWYGDLDVAAATAFLASRVEIDPRRIGVVGFSMGGEEAIGAAATDQRIRAVVAEGATGRTAADKGWLSDSYGWRGWLQEGVERVQYGVADYFSEASPPISLRSAVATASNTRFLLVTAGKVGDEGRAAAFIRAAASDRVAVWTVDGARHIGGFAAQPQEWTRRVVEFLDDQLR